MNDDVIMLVSQILFRTIEDDEAQTYEDQIYNGAFNDGLQTAVDIVINYFREGSR